MHIDSANSSVQRRAAGRLDANGRPALAPAIAAVDIGTNSIHMVIARWSPGHRFEVLTREKESVRLGSGGGSMKRLDDDAIERGVATLARCRRLADSWDATLVAVATSAVREAENARTFIRRAAREARVDVQIISGHEEARLIHLGVLEALPLYDADHLVCDIGGGSTEVVVASGSTIHLARSVRLGAIRLTRRHVGDQPWRRKTLRAAREEVRDAIVPVRHESRRHSVDIAAASSGTAETLLRIALGRRGDPLPRTLNGVALSRAEVTDITSELAEMTVDERCAVPGIDERRADIIVAGAIILDEVGRAFGVDEWIFSDAALREGLLLDTVQRALGPTAGRADLRGRSVRHLVETCDEDPDHSMMVARLAVQLFDGCSALHGYGDAERELLHAAALLANVGLFISHSKHHQHSYYVIRNSDLLSGFVDSEIEVIAQVARYHRRSEPSERHAPFAVLEADDQRRVRWLAGLLRVAIGLDRAHDAAVRSVAVKVSKTRIVLKVEPQPDASEGTLALEQAAATARSRLLAAMSEREVDVRVDRAS